MSVYETPLWEEVRKKIDTSKGDSNFKFEIESRGVNLLLIIQEGEAIIGSFDFPNTPQGRERLVKWIVHLMEFPNSKWQEGLVR